MVDPEELIVAKDNTIKHTSSPSFLSRILPSVFIGVDHCRKEEPKAVVFTG
jgi:hypothetical protein